VSRGFPGDPSWIASFFSRDAVRTQLLDLMDTGAITCDIDQETLCQRP
jgi:hypothetical protein